MEWIQQFLLSNRSNFVRSALVFFFSVCYSGICKGQLLPTKFEFGSTLLTLNLYDQAYRPFESRPHAEILNGIFVRCSKNRHAWRAFASYVANFSSFGGPNQPFS